MEYVCGLGPSSKRRWTVGRFAPRPAVSVVRTAQSLPFQTTSEVIAAACGASK